MLQRKRIKLILSKATRVLALLLLVQLQAACALFYYPPEEEDHHSVVEEHLSNPYSVHNLPAIPEDNDADYYYYPRGVPKAEPSADNQLPRGYSPRPTVRKNTGNLYPIDNDEGYVYPTKGYGRTDEEDEGKSYVQPLFH